MVKLAVEGSNPMNSSHVLGVPESGHLRGKPLVKARKGHENVTHPSSLPSLGLYYKTNSSRRKKSHA